MAPSINTKKSRYATHCTKCGGYVATANGVAAPCAGMRTQGPRTAFLPFWPSRPSSMIRIAISQAAFDAIARTMPFGSVNFEAGVDANGERYIWLPRAVVDRLRSLRGPGESFSDVILRLAAGSEPR